MKYEAIQAHITYHRLERTVVLSELIAEAILKSWQMARRAASGLRAIIEGTTDYLPRSQA